MGRPLRIAVNTRLLLAGRLEGIGWFAHETLSRIVRAHPEHTFLFFFDRPFDPQFVYGPNVQPIVAGPPARHPILFRIWFNWTVTRLLKKHKADLFLSPDGYLSLRTDVPSVPVIHDINFEHFPKDLPRAHSEYYRKFFPRFARKAAQVITVSEFSKQDIAVQYEIDPNRIDVVHNGVSPVYLPLDEAGKKAARKRFAEGHQYIIVIGSLHPRKNIARTLQAFDRLCDRVGHELRLLIVGDSFYWDKQMRSALQEMQHKDRVVFTGRLQQKDLAVALGGATCLAYLSYFEGFGIPVVEAMRAGVPVVAANATSLPEVAGNAALFCDPFDVASITDGLTRVVQDPALRIELATKGMVQAQRYDWDRTANGVWDSLMKALDGEA